MTPVLRVRNVGWRAGTVPVLERVSFDVGPGEFVAVMGRNGAGKSTLLDIVAGLRTPTEGAVLLADRPLDEWTAIERARLLSHLPQSVRADLSMRSEALVLMGRYAHAERWFESDEDGDIAEEAMRRCECLEFRASHPGHAQRRRAPAGVSRGLSGTASRVCCCSTSPRHFSTSISSCSASASCARRRTAERPAWPSRTTSTLR